MRHTAMKLPESCATQGISIKVCGKSACTNRATNQPWAKRSCLFVLLVMSLLGAACAARQEAHFTQEKGQPVVSTEQPTGDELAGAGATQIPVPFAPSASTAFQQGQEELQAERYEQAAAWLERAIALDGTQAEYYLWLGRAYGYQAQRAAPGAQFFLARKVRQCLEKAVEVNPELLAARLDLLSFYLQAPSLVGGSLEKAKIQATEIARRDAEQGERAWQLCQNATQSVAPLFALPSRGG
jgi:tetratricopeptide (TPR) repeat protein